MFTLNEDVMPAVPKKSYATRTITSRSLSWYYGLLLQQHDLDILVFGVHEKFCIECNLEGMDWTQKLDAKPSRPHLLLALGSA